MLSNEQWDEELKGAVFLDSLVHSGKAACLTTIIRRAEEHLTAATSGSDPKQTKRHLVPGCFLPFYAFSMLIRCEYNDKTVDKLIAIYGKLPALCGQAQNLIKGVTDKSDYDRYATRENLANLNALLVDKGAPQVEVFSTKEMEDGMIEIRSNLYEGRFDDQVKELGISF